MLSLIFKQKMWNSSNDMKIYLRPKTRCDCVVVNHSWHIAGGAACVISEMFDLDDHSHGGRRDPSLWSWHLECALWYPLHLIKLYYNQILLNIFSIWFYCKLGLDGIRPVSLWPPLSSWQPVVRPLLLAAVHLSVPQRFFWIWIYYWILLPIMIGRVSKIRG